MHREWHEKLMSCQRTFESTHLETKGDRSFRIASGDSHDEVPPLA